MNIVKPLTFEGLRYGNVQRNKEWDSTDQITAAFRGLEFTGEAGELIEKAMLMLDLASLGGRIDNMVKKLERERLGLKGSRVTLFELASEMADTQITLDLLAMHFCIDLAEATRLTFNAKSEEHGFRTRI